MNCDLRSINLAAYPFKHRYSKLKYFRLKLVYGYLYDTYTCSKYPKLKNC